MFRGVFMMWKDLYAHAFSEQATIQKVAVNDKISHFQAEKKTVIDFGKNILYNEESTIELTEVSKEILRVGERMEEKREDNRITLTPCSKSELEADILEYLCLQNKKKIPVTEVQVCQHFHLLKKSLTAILKQMLEKGYLEQYEKNGEIALTPYGIREGNEYLYRHYSISQFLQFIGVQEATADQDACRAEHILTDETVQALCTYVNNDNQHYERKIRNSDLTDRYAPGRYEGMMEIYSMEQCRPRKFREENADYTGTIFLEIDQEGWFELQYAEKTGEKTLWYKNADGVEGVEWVKAECGEQGERIPVNAFEFVLKANEVLMEGHLLVAFTEGDEQPNLWNSGQLEVELW